MRYRLRTLLIVLALGPPVLAAAWTCSIIAEDYRVLTDPDDMELIKRLVLDPRPFHPIARFLADRSP